MELTVHAQQWQQLREYMGRMDLVEDRDGTFRAPGLVVTLEEQPTPLEPRMVVRITGEADAVEVFGSRLRLWALRAER